MSDIIGYTTVECGYEDSEIKPCEIKAMDCEDCEYGLAIWHEVIK